MPTRPSKSAPQPVFLQCRRRFRRLIASRIMIPCLCPVGAEELMFLAKIWGFRSNIWRRRKSLAAGKAQGGSSEAAAAAPAAPRSSEVGEPKAEPSTSGGSGSDLGSSYLKAATLSGQLLGADRALAAITPAAPVSVLAGPVPAIDRTALTADVDTTTLVRQETGSADSICCGVRRSIPAQPATARLLRRRTSSDIETTPQVLCLQHNTMKRFQEIGDAALEIHITVCESTRAQWRVAQMVSR